MSAGVVYYIIPVLTLINAENVPKYVAVVEYQSIQEPGFTTDEALNRNAEEYVRIIAELSRNYNLTVAVFPEETLDNVGDRNGLMASAVQIVPTESPCMSSHYPKFLRTLSCAAAKYSTRVMVNLIEKKYPLCFTSDVLLDQEGYIDFSIKREDRIGADFLHHQPIAFAIPTRFPFLLFEFEDPNSTKATIFNPTSLVTGFRFSHEKVLSPTEQRIYLISSNWISQLPFLTSLQVYQMWAQEFGVTLLFSGANNPTKGQGGTGIIHATGEPILMDIIASGGTKAFVYKFFDTNLPGVLMTPQKNKSIDELAKEMDKFHLEKDPDLSKYRSVPLDLQQTRSNRTVCYESNNNNNNSFCCNFYLKMSFKKPQSNRKQYTYHLIAYRGPKTYYNILSPGGVEICAVIACLDSTVDSCGQRFQKYEAVKWPVTFHEIEITARFKVPRKEKIYYSSQFPNSLLSSMRPIAPNLTEWTGTVISDNDTNTSYFLRRFRLIRPQDRILTFGIFGRNFTLPSAVSVAPKSAVFLNPVLIVASLFIFVC